MWFDEEMNPRTAKPAVLVISALAICAYFLALAGPGLRAGFTTDDLVNLAKYSDQPLAALVKLSTAS